MKYAKAVENIVVNCLSVIKEDRVLVITDLEQQEIGRAIHKKALTVTNSAKLLIIEDHISRPAKELPEGLISEIRKFSPTVSVYAANGQIGELPVFRQPLRKLLVEKLGARHAHMVGINEKLMLDGMSQDYKLIQKATAKLFGILSSSKEINVSDSHGTNLVVKISPKLKWKICDGVISKPGFWTNLPDGEVFTCPEKVDGKIAAFVIGDHFSDIYGVLDDPLIIGIKNSRIVKVSGKNSKLVSEFKKYITQEKNSNRVGEFAVGTLLGLKEFTGNLLQDEKFPGVHIAFGGSYSEETGATWDANSHVDVIPKDVSIWVDGKEIMKDGRFIIFELKYKGRGVGHR